MKRKISEMKQHVNSKETSMAICLSPSDLPTCDPDSDAESVFIEMTFIS